MILKFKNLLDTKLKAYKPSKLLHTLSNWEIYQTKIKILRTKLEIFN